MAAEYFDVINEQDQVVGVASAKDVKEKKLLHRSANVIVLNSSGQIYIHQRAPETYPYPNMWDVKFGGSVRSGESYKTAAERELGEEAGIINLKLTEIATILSLHPQNPVIRKIFTTIYDGEINLDPTEVAKGEFRNIQDLEKDIHNGQFSPSAIDVFAEFIKNRQAA